MNSRTAGLFFAGLLIVTNLNAITVYTIGNSTMADKRNPETNKERGWGMVFSQFFDGTVVTVSNHARNGRSSKSFYNEGRWDAILSTMRPGDYVIIQFGHNDQKEEQPALYTDPDPSCTDPKLSYRVFLKMYVNDTRAKGAIPILMTSVVRRDFDENGILRNTLGVYPDAVREVAAELGVPFIDMEKKSRELVQRLGVEESKSLYMISTGKNDNTHFVEKGATAMARLAAEGIYNPRTTLCWQASGDACQHAPHEP